MNEIRKKIDSVCPLFAIIPLLSCFIFNVLIYSGTMTFCANLKHYDLTTAFDRAVPLVPQWMYIYFGCYLFWVVNYILVARINRHDKTTFYRFVVTDLLSRLVCAVFFIFLPTTNQRPEVIGNSFSHLLLRFLYAIDQPTNLFPSIHCLVSWLCFVGIRKSPQVSGKYKAFSCLFALLVVASTQFTKQHYIVDAIAGILIAETLYLISMKVDLYRPVQRGFEWINAKLTLSEG